jgi:cytochrome b561
MRQYLFPAISFAAATDCCEGFGAGASTQSPHKLHKTATLDGHCCAETYAGSEPAETKVGSMTETLRRSRCIKYPVSIRILHWVRAVLVLGLIACGWFMAGRAEGDATAGFLYPNHKQFGILVWLLALVHLTLRWRYLAVLPHAPEALNPWEKRLSRGTHRLIIALTLLTPLLGYAMSSSVIGGDGVPFFFLPHVPEILPKSDAAFAVFQALHRYCAYLLLACVVLHISGAIKHRLQDKDGETDVLPRML